MEQPEHRNPNPLGSNGGHGECQYRNADNNLASQLRHEDRAWQEQHYFATAIRQSRAANLVNGHSVPAQHSADTFGIIVVLLVLHEELDTVTIVLTISYHAASADRPPGIRRRELDGNMFLRDQFDSGEQCQSAFIQLVAAPLNNGGLVDLVHHQAYRNI